MLKAMRKSTKRRFKLWRRHFATKLVSRNTSVLLNERERDLNERHVSSWLKVNRSRACLISGELVTPGGVTRKGAILSLLVYDAHGRRVKGELSGFSVSPAYGPYKYIPGSPQGSRFLIQLDLPRGAYGIKVGIRPKRGVYGRLSPGASVEFIRARHCQRLQKADLAIKVRQGRSALEVHDVAAVISGQRQAVAKYICSALANRYREADPYLSGLLHWQLWRLTQSHEDAMAAKNMLTQSGAILRLGDFLKEVVQRRHGAVDDLAYQRNKCECDLLRNGFPHSRLNGESQAYPQRKTILYLLHNSLPYNCGGYATRSHGIISAINEIGEFKVVGVSRPGYPTDHRKYIANALPSPVPQSDVIDGVTYERLDQSVRKSAMTIVEYIQHFAEQVAEMAMKHKACIIHAASNFPNGIAAAIAARKLGIRCVYEVRGLWEVTRLSRQPEWDKTDQYRLQSRLEAEACNLADRVFTLTRALKRIMIDRGVSGRPIDIAPNCVHTARFDPQPKNVKLLEKYNISQDDVVVGYVGSVVNYEGIDCLVRAFKLLVNDGIANFKFLLVGDGAYLPEVVRLVDSLGINDHCIICGRVPHSEVASLYSLVDICPFPRKPYLVCEAVSPLKPFEAMACGKAVLVSSCDALTEIVEDGKNGVVFEKGSIDSLRRQLANLIANTDLRRRVSAQARDWVCANHDWSRLGAEVNAVYSELYDQMTHDKDDKEVGGRVGIESCRIA